METTHFPSCKMEKSQELTGKWKKIKDEFTMENGHFVGCKMENTMNSCSFFLPILGHRALCFPFVSQSSKDSLKSLLEPLSQVSGYPLVVMEHIPFSFILF